MADHQRGKFVHEGEAYYSVIAAARLLGTTTPKVRRLMGAGTLEWTQFRPNGPLRVTARSIADYKASLATAPPATRK